MEKMTHGSLFSGIGGFDLAAKWAGWKNVFHCEWQPFNQRILKYHFPESVSYGDITKTDFKKWRGAVDVLSGGFPCQPFSAAGKRKGTADDRYLWPEMLRAIREIAPRWIVGENVSGLVNWSQGLVFEQVCADLEAEGYEVWPVVLPACGVNAPHRRDRIWFVAHSKSNRDRGGLHELESPDGSKWKPEEHWQNNLQLGYNGKIGLASDTGCDGYELRELGKDRQAPGEGESEEDQRERLWPEFGGIGGPQVATDSDGIGRQRPGDTRSRGPGLADGYCNSRGNASNAQREGLEGQDGFGLGGPDKPTQHIAANASSAGQQKRNAATEPDAAGYSAGSFVEAGHWERFPTQSPVCSGDDGLPRELDGVTFSKWRNESIKGYGNAIVPQVAYQIFETINNFENSDVKN